MVFFLKNSKMGWQSLKKSIYPCQNISQVPPGEVLFDFENWDFVCFFGYAVRDFIFSLIFVWCWVEPMTKSIWIFHPLVLLFFVFFQRWKLEKSCSSRVECLIVAKLHLLNSMVKGNESRSKKHGLSDDFRTGNIWRSRTNHWISKRKIKQIYQKKWKTVSKTIFSGLRVRPKRSKEMEKHW